MRTPTKSDAESRPPFVAPMLASAATELPPGDDWSFEMKWDGVRAIAMIGPDAVELRSRAGFDGHQLTELVYAERRALLNRLGARGDAWDTPPNGHDGSVAFSTNAQLGFEGVVAKRFDSRYESGRRSRSWRKVKHQRRQEFVVGGWVPGQGGRANRIGALLLGVYNADGALRYVGKVGTGFNEAELDRLGTELATRPSDISLFSDRDLPRDARFVNPELVVEVRFTEWTTHHHLRHPAYVGQRDDTDPREVRRE